MRQQSGQAILLVVISLAVVMTVVLSVVARSVTDVRIAVKEEESLRAFSAAEAGVEKALVSNLTGTQTVIAEDLTNSSFTAQVSNFAQNLSEFNYPKELISGDAATVWFVSHDTGGSLVCNSGAGLPCFTGSAIRICWGEQGTSGNSATTPAVEAAVFFDPSPSVAGSYSDMSVARATYDPNAGRRSSNSFASPDGGTCTIAGKTYQFQKNITFTDLGIPGGSTTSQNGLQLARVRLLYNTTTAQPIGVSVTGSGLPGQGKQISSTGNSGGATRKVEVYTLYPGFPSVFDSAVFSEVAITK